MKRKGMWCLFWQNNEARRGAVFVLQNNQMGRGVVFVHQNNVVVGCIEDLRRFSGI